MPDELTVAIQAAIARARERCPACDLGYEDHTCGGDLEVVKNAMLAAVYRAIDIADEDVLGPQDAADAVVAEIEHLLREGSEGGNGDS